MSSVSEPAPAGPPAAADERWMRAALALAERAAAAGEVPVGAVCVLDGEVIGRGWNRPIAASDPSAHAEILALREAGAARGNYRLPGTTLYATLEPCAMCAGALVQARVARLVYAAPDPRAGAAGSRFELLDGAVLNHRVAVEGGCLGEAAGRLLRGFFQARRGGGD